MHRQNHFSDKDIATGDKDMPDTSYIPGYKNLEVWKQADELAVLIYQITKGYPKEELFVLTSQMRRCAISVPANVVEGYGRRTLKDKSHFYYIARGSLNELEYYLDISFRLNYLSSVNYEKATALRNRVGKLLYGLIQSVKE